MLVSSSIGLSHLQYGYFNLFSNCLFYYFDNFKEILQALNFKGKQVHFLNQFSEKNLFQCLLCHRYRHLDLI